MVESIFFLSNPYFPSLSLSIYIYIHIYIYKYINIYIYLYLYLHIDTHNGWSIINASHWHRCDLRPGSKKDTGGDKNSAMARSSEDGI